MSQDSCTSAELIAQKAGYLVTDGDSMGMTFNAHDASAYEALDRLLFREWDPIGVYGMDGPDDEYRSYLPEFWKLVTSGAQAEEVAEYLGSIERERICVETSAQHRIDIARKATALLTAWRTPVRN